MALKKFIIRVEKSPAVYAPGDIITGEVFVELNRPKLCRGIKLRFKGGAKVHWIKNRMNEAITEEQHYFNEEIYVVGSSCGEVELVPGEYIYPFTFLLPTNIPNSFNYRHGRVEYNIKGVMEISSRTEEPTYLVFTVYSPLDLSQVPSTPIMDEVHEDYYCLMPCINEGYMGGQICIPKRTYEVGEQLEVFIDVEMNSKNVEIMKVQLQLKQISEFHAGGSTKSFIVILQSVEKRWPLRSNTSVKLGFRIPEVFHSGLQHCSIIEIIYRLRVKFLVTECHRDTEKEYEIKIGRKSVTSPVILDDSRFSAPPAATAELPPRKPPAPVLSVPEFVGYAAAIVPTPHPRPCDPLPSIGFRIASPSAPVEPTSATEPPPPSYESVMAQEHRK